MLSQIIVREYSIPKNMADLILDRATLFIRETYHEIYPEEIPEVEYFTGRPLNLTDDTELIDEHTSTDGHRIVCANEIFEDSHGMRFRVIDVLGNGTYSYVYKCQVVSEPTKFVALKILKNQPQYRATGIAEIMIHQQMQNAPDMDGKQHVGNPISTFEINGHICMVMPLLQRSLFEGIGQDDPPLVLLSTIRLICEQLLKALNFIHTIGIIHCDVKPDNILYTNESNDNILLIDFGSATNQLPQIGQYIQSRFYRSPEIMLGLPYDAKIDIWSVGCIAAELYLDFAIFACDNESDSIHSMVGLLGNIDPNLLQRSRGWWKFFDMTKDGYSLKFDPIDVLMNKHLYHESVFQTIGVRPLHQMLLDHFPLTTEQEFETLNCFNHFVHTLLNFDSEQRPSAAEALQHPFILGEKLPQEAVYPTDF